MATISTFPSSVLESSLTSDKNARTAMRVRSCNHTPRLDKDSRQLVLVSLSCRALYPEFHPHSARQLVWSPLRALSDHSIIVGAQRAQRPCQLPRISPSKLDYFSHKEVADGSPNCARPTRAFIGRALREQRGPSGSILFHFTHQYYPLPKGGHSQVPFLLAERAR